MKHGISPTTPRNRRWEKHTIVHLSKALVQRVVDFSKAVDGKVQVQYLPLHLQAPPSAAVQIVLAPDRGTTYRCRVKHEEFEIKRSGLRRRYALSGRALTAERLNTRHRKPSFWSWL